MMADTTVSFPLDEDCIIIRPPIGDAGGDEDEHRGEGSSFMTQSPRPVYLLQRGKKQAT